MIVEIDFLRMIAMTGFRMTALFRELAGFAGRGPGHRLGGILMAVWLIGNGGGLGLCPGGQIPQDSRPAPSGIRPAHTTASPPDRLDGALAYEILQTVCRLGPRISGSPAMTSQQQMLEAHFSQLPGAIVIWQPFSAAHPVRRDVVEMRNMLVQFHPDRMTRILIACHYDTRPFPDRDPQDPAGVFLGANDGASGVGLLYELGQFMPALESEFGVDFVFFDGEEFVFLQGRDPYLLGSTHFARQYVAGPPAWRYSAAVLVDMIGDKELQLYYEKNSWRYARDITRQIWDVAAREGIGEFIPRTRHEVKDDHLPLNTIARIPTCDIIDFDYPNPSSNPKNRYWHTREDTPDKCSAESLAKVGNVLLTWLREVRMQR